MSSLLYLLFPLKFTTSMQPYCEVLMKFMVQFLALNGSIHKMFSWSEGKLMLLLFELFFY